MLTIACGSFILGTVFGLIARPYFTLIIIVTILLTAIFGLTLIR